MVSGKKIAWTGEQSGTTQLSAAVFGAGENDQLLFDAVISQLASRRQGTAKTKKRGEVSGGNKKPFRQKGTGHARQGSSRSPLNPGGGQVFGPQPRDYTWNLPKKMKLGALKSALGQRAKEEKIYVLDNADIKKPSTKLVAQMMVALGLNKALFIGQADENLALSVRNIPTAKYLDVRSLNVFDVMKFEHLVLSSESLKALEERLAS